MTGVATRHGPPLMKSDRLWYSPKPVRQYAWGHSMAWPTSCTDVSSSALLKSVSGLNTAPSP